MMTRSLTLAALVLGTTIARAQAPVPPPDPAQPAPPQAPLTDDEKKAKAKALYEQGLSAYNLGNFDEAIKVFSEAYALSAAPGLLFNIAQSHRLKKDYERATYFYQTYLRLKPDASNRPDVEARLAEMAKLIEEQKEMERRPPAGTVTPDGQQQNTTTTTTTIAPVPQVDKAPDPDALAKAQKLQTIGLITAGGGGVLLVTGFVFGALASSAESDLNELSTSGGTWSAAHQNRYDAGRRNNRIAIVSLALGGVALVTGGTLYTLGMLKKKDAQVAIEPTRGGTTIAVGWSF